VLLLPIGLGCIPEPDGLVFRRRCIVSIAGRLDVALRECDRAALSVWLWTMSAFYYDGDIQNCGAAMKSSEELGAPKMRLKRHGPPAGTSS